jgi:hypothetical protein
MGGTNMEISKDCFVLNGKKTLYLADTAWRGVYKSCFDDWVEYLQTRKNQGFNAIQMNFTPWEDYGMILKDNFLDQLEEKVRVVFELGMTPVIVVVWCGCVPGTWATVSDTSNVLPIRILEDFAKEVVRRFNKYNPIFLSGGDVDFRSGEAIEYYSLITKTIKENTNRPVSVHLARGWTDVPREIDQYIDFYAYQSGHDRHHQELTWKLAQEFYKRGKPVINAEICYEGIGYKKDGYRFNPFDVRKAFWQSFLSGSFFGIGYGAHGIWNWCEVAGEETERHLSSFTWKDALRMEGANDVCFARWLIEKLDFFGLKPSQEVLLSPENSEIRVARNEKNCIIYAPFATRMVLDINSKDIWGINMETRDVFVPRVDLKDNHTKVDILNHNSDSLIIIEY